MIGAPPIPLFHLLLDSGAANFCTIEPCRVADG